MEGGSLPNPASFPIHFPLHCFGVEELQVLAWNGSGICLADRAARIAMGHHIKRPANSAHILCFQEVHGEEGDAFHQLSRWLPGWKISVSCSIRAVALLMVVLGGVAMAICPKLKDVSICNTQYIVLGRCMASSICVKF